MPELDVRELFVPPLVIGRASCAHQLDARGCVQCGEERFAELFPDDKPRDLTPTEYVARTRISHKAPAGSVYQRAIDRERWPITEYARRVALRIAPENWDVRALFGNGGLW